MTLADHARRLVRDERILAALGRISRRDFLPSAIVDSAEVDDALPIGKGQTSSQPSLSAYMAELLGLGPGSRVLEVGTGSGYQTALLAELSGQVFTVELIETLGTRAREILSRLGYRNIRFRIRDGSLGWPEEAPFDAAIVSCAAPSVPPALLEQLKVGGRLVVPLGRPGVDSFGPFDQQLWLIEKTAAGLRQERKLPVRFVPLRT
jgi:protein-L-isoaspartate(D-aspartate) O-methyltransferase